jgi:hypothetical protein
MFDRRGRKFPPMPAQWAAVETLIRDLGGVRAAAFGMHASQAASAAVEQAIREATEAVADTLDAPADPAVIARAHEAIEVVADVLATFDHELVRSLRVRARGAELRSRAKELIEKSRGHRQSSVDGLPASSRK